MRLVRPAPAAGRRSRLTARAPSDGPDPACTKDLTHREHHPHHHGVPRADGTKPQMRLIIVRHADTDWTLAGRYMGTTDLSLTAHGREQAASLTSLLERLLDGQPGAQVSSPRRRATETAQLALPAQHMAVDPLVAEYRLRRLRGSHRPTDPPARSRLGHLARRMPRRRVDRRRWPASRRLPPRAHADRGTQPVVVTHGHFSRILAGRALGLAPECGRLFASTTATVSLIEDHDGEECLGFWNVDTALLGDAVEQPTDPGGPPADALHPVVGSRT